MYSYLVLKIYLHLELNPKWVYCSLNWRDCLSPYVKSRQVEMPTLSFSQRQFHYSTTFCRYYLGLFLFCMFSNKFIQVCFTKYYQISCLNNWNHSCSGCYTCIMHCRTLVVVCPWRLLSDRLRLYKRLFCYMIPVL